MRSLSSCRVPEAQLDPVFYSVNVLATDEIERCVVISRQERNKVNNLRMVLIGVLRRKKLSADHLARFSSLNSLESLYKEGLREMLEVGDWPSDLVLVRSYLESGGLLGYSVDRLLAGSAQDPSVISRHRALASLL